MGLLVERQDSGLAEAFENPRVREYRLARGGDLKPIRVLLKRIITIEDGQLLDVEDVYEHDSVSGEGKVDEHETMARVDSPVLVVQAAAGSGGRQVLMSRLDYLISPFGDVE